MKKTYQRRVVTKVINVRAVWSWQRFFERAISALLALIVMDLILKTYLK